MSRVVELLEQGPAAIGSRSPWFDNLAAAADRGGLWAHRERPLLAGGTLELLITTDDPTPAVSGVSGVAVVVAAHGATDALRGRLRHLAAHREIAAIVLATTRPRHRTLAGEVRHVPVHVVVLEPDRCAVPDPAGSSTTGPPAPSAGRSGPAAGDREQAESLSAAT